MPFRPDVAGNDSNGVPKGASTAASRARVTNVNADGGDGHSIGIDRTQIPAARTASASFQTDRESAAHLATPTDPASAPINTPALRAGPPTAYHVQNEKAGTSNRRRQSSIPKIPMGPRPLDLAPGKR